jgi:hypothetical protein
MTSIKPTPHFGWIRGQFSGGSVDLNFDRRQNSVSGESLGDSVSVSTSQDDKWVTGQAHAQEVKLEQDWSPRLVKLNGWANGARYTMTVDYDRNQANGSSAGRSIALQFDREQGWIRGQGAAGQVDVKLSQDGQLSGRLDGAPVQAEMINLDLGHLLSHWYLVTR